LEDKVQFKVETNRMIGYIRSILLLTLTSHGCLVFFAPVSCLNRSVLVVSAVVVMDRSRLFSGTGVRVMMYNSVDKQVHTHL
jgi:hypothetical protein